jgi:hypothetical protein
MDDCAADLFTDFGFAGADSFNILLIQHDVIRPGREVKYALLGRGHAMKETQKQFPLLPRLRVRAGWAARPPPEQQRYGCFCIQQSDTTACTSEGENCVKIGRL